MRFMRCAAIACLSAVCVVASVQAGEPDSRQAALARALEAGDNHAAFAAMEQLALAGGSMAEMALAKAFGSRNAWIRRAALRALGVTGGKNAEDICLRALRDPDAMVRLDACAVATRITSRADRGGIVDALVTRLGDTRPGVRSEAALALGLIRDARAVGALDALARRDADVRVRAAALESLGKIGGAVAALTARDLLEDDVDDRVRRTAALALSWIAPDFASEVLARSLRDVSERVRIASAAGLGNLATPEAINALEAALQLDDDDLRAEAVNALSKSGTPQARIVLRDALKSISAVVRRRSAEMLGHLADRDSLPSLVALVGDRDPDVRAAGVEAVGRLADPKGAEAARAGMTDRSGEVRARAAEAAGRMMDSACLNGLVNLARPEFSDGERVAAVSAIGFIGDVRAGRMLEMLLADQSEYVRRAAATALAHLGVGAQVLLDHTQYFTDNARLDYLGALALLRYPKARALFEQEAQKAPVGSAMRFPCEVGLYLLGDAARRAVVWDGARGAHAGANPSLALAALILAKDGDVQELVAQIMNAGPETLRENAVLAVGVARPSWAGFVLRDAVGDPDSSVALRARVALRWFEVRGPRE